MRAGSPGWGYAVPFTLGILAGWVAESGGLWLVLIFTVAAAVLYASADAVIQDRRRRRTERRAWRESRS